MSVLRNRFFGAVLASAMAFPSIGNAADGDVSYMDIREKPEGFVEIAGHEASGRNRIALMVNGGDEDLLRTIYTAAQEIETNTDRDVWFLHSVDANPDDGRTEIDIYVSGRKTGSITVLSPENFDGSSLVSAVTGAIERIAATASLSNPEGHVLLAASNE